MAPSTDQPGKDLVKTFQVLDSVAKVLIMILEGKDAATVSPAVAKLHARFQHCESVLDNLPGGDMTKEVQLRKIKSLRDSISKRRALVEKYANLDVLRAIAESDGQSVQGNRENSTSAAPFGTSTSADANTGDGQVDFSTQLNKSGNDVEAPLAPSADNLFGFGTDALSGGIASTDSHRGQSGILSTANLNTTEGDSREKDLEAMVL